VALSFITASPWMVILYPLLLGGSGGGGTVGSLLWADAYGPENIATLRSVDQASKLVATALSPLPLALSHDLLGSYVPGLWLFCGLALLGAAASWLGSQRRPNAAVAATA
jgi:hypothetical protein